jgi:hypothetical protein
MEANLNLQSLTDLVSTLNRVNTTSPEQNIPYRNPNSDTRSEPYRNSNSDPQGDPYRNSNSDTRGEPYRNSRSSARNVPYRSSNLSVRNVPYWNSNSNARNVPHRGTHTMYQNERNTVKPYESLHQSHHRRQYDTTSRTQFDNSTKHESNVKLEQVTTSPFNVSIVDSPVTCELVPGGSDGLKALLTEFDGKDVDPNRRQSVCNEYFFELVTQLRKVTTQMNQLIIKYEFTEAYDPEYPDIEPGAYYKQ